jgi:hypothetical protein
MTEKTLNFTDLIGDLMAGEITADYFRKQMAVPEVLAQFDTHNLTDMGDIARERAGSGHWQKSLKLYDVLVQALFDNIEKINPETFYIACADYLFVTTEALKDIPNGRLLKFATHVAEQASNLAQSMGDSFWAGILESRIGALHLLPYGGKRDPSNYDAEIGKWLDREQRNPFDDAEPIAMPKPLEAFTIATMHFEKALDLNSSYGRGFVAKSLAECFIWQQRLGKKLDLARVAQLLDRAEAELSEKEIDWRLEVEVFRKALGLSASVNNVIDNAENVEVQPLRFGLTAFENESAKIRALAVTDPNAAIRRIEKIWPEAQDEKSRVHLEKIYTQTLVAATGILKKIAKPARFGSKPKLFRREVEKIVAEIVDTMSSPQVARFKAAIAVVSNQYDAEEVGIELAYSALDLLDDEPYTAEIISILISTLMVDYGATAWHSKNYQVAARRYVQAAGTCFDLGLYDMSRATLERAYEAIYQANFPADRKLVLLLSAYAPAIEGTDDSGSLATHTRHIWNGFLGRAMEQQSKDSQLVMLLMQSSKSGMFSALLANPRRWSWQRDAYIANLFERHRTLEQNLKDTETWSLPNEENLLVALNDHTRAEGENNRQRLFNIEAVIDREIRDRMAKGIGRSDHYPIIPLENVLALLDDRTVLLTTYAGRTTSGELAVWTLLLTRSECNIGVFHGGAMPNVYLGVQIGEGLMDDLGLFIANLRESVQIDAGEIMLREDEAGDLLQQLESLFLRSLAPKLNEYKAQGLDHLAICPHGSAHFLPWHLLELSERTPLANDWIVTYIPSLVTLQQNKLPTASAQRFVAFGMSFADNCPHPVPPLPHIPDELESIKSVTGAEVFLDSDATESNFYQASASATHVHIATHGKIQVAAPAYHMLYLQPDENSDGVVRAYELLELDLKGIDLVTMSACDTSLGRVDVGDNLRGIPSSLFLAGVRTIIGTLWEVDSGVSALFFKTFYQTLHSGSKKLDAFRIAQIATREEYPAYCHWGAFQYSGGW